MTTDLLSRKIGRHFDRIDVNGDGRIDQGDFALIVSLMREEFPEPSAEPKLNALNTAYQGLWERIRRDMDIDSDGTVSREEYVKYLQSDRKSSYRAAIQPVAKAIIDLADIDGDGMLDDRELAKVHRALNMDAKDHQAAMAKLDLDGDGRVSEAELVQALEEFFTSEDPEAGGNFLFGEF
ncbi:EF-hand domain-containing protein [Actinomadura sp. 6N118]|uniref:EF-hand domain-containing protein n=1 Tax=Actinomadura sp. 6N118 TaxID=3375151 RepID=UPI0037B3E00B